MTFFRHKNLFFFLLIFLFLGLLTRFWAIDHPKEMVFDEVHFFNFSIQHEKGEYYFDIHPPLGKLILWSNGQFFGMNEYGEKAKEESVFIKNFLSTQYNLKQQIKELQLNTDSFKNDKEVKRLMKAYDENQDRYASITKKDSTDKFENYNIGQGYTEDITVWGIRALPAFFGALLIPLIFLFIFFLTQNFWVSSLGASLVLFSPALIVESGYVLMDSLLFFFLVMGVFLLFVYDKYRFFYWFLLSVFFLSLAISIKWTGLSGFGVLLLFLAKWSLEKRDIWAKVIQITINLLVFIIALLTIYALTFWAHFSSLPQSGKGDPYHSKEFQSTLEGSVYENKVEPLTEIEKFFQLNADMWRYNSNNKGIHGDMSNPYDWIKGEKPILYWQRNVEPDTSLGFSFLGIFEIFNTRSNNEFLIQKIYLFPNPFVWSVITITTLFLFFYFSWQIGFFIFQYIRKSLYKNYSTFPSLILSPSEIIIIFTVLGNILPFLFVSRSQFLYHAFPAFLFGVILLCLFFNRFFSSAIQRFFVLSLIGFSFFFFLIYNPIIYGSAITLSQAEWMSIPTLWWSQLF